MRDWTKPLLVVCVVALGAGLFLLERRIGRLESQLTAARSGIASMTASGESLGAAGLIAGDAETRASRTYTLHVTPPQSDVAQLRYERLGRHNVEVVPLPPAVQNRGRQRTPSGEINGVPYYVIPLADSKD